MRTIVNISLPLPLSRVVDEAVSRGNFASKSEFFRDLLRKWLEGRLLTDLEKSRDELKKGKGKVLKSLRDLR